MKKIGVLVMAMTCLFAGMASAEMHVDGYPGGARGNNTGQATTTKKLPDTEKNNVTQFRHLQPLPLISPPHEPPADIDFKPSKQRWESLHEPDFM